MVSCNRFVIPPNSFLHFLSRPRIHDRNLQIREMPYVLGSKRGAPRKCDACDLRVTHVHWTPNLLPRGCQRRRFIRCSAIEIQHAVF